jgi:hypothetical protein
VPASSSSRTTLLPQKPAVLGMWNGLRVLVALSASDPGPLGIHSPLITLDTLSSADLNTDRAISSFSYVQAWPRHVSPSQTATAASGTTRDRAPVPAPPGLDASIEG